MIWGPYFLWEQFVDSLMKNKIHFWICIITSLILKLWVSIHFPKLYSVPLTPKMQCILWVLKPQIFSPLPCHYCILLLLWKCPHFIVNSLQKNQRLSKMYFSDIFNGLWRTFWAAACSGLLRFIESCVCFVCAALLIHRLSRNISCVSGLLPAWCS